jgi:hypothetical protein
MRVHLIVFTGLLFDVVIIFGNFLDRDPLTTVLYNGMTL